jgi:hypothetical protein
MKMSSLPVLSFATNASQYRNFESSLPQIFVGYTGTIVPDDLRVQLPKRIVALASSPECGIPSKAIFSALEFCHKLPLVRIPDSVYEDDGAIALYWKMTGEGSVLILIDAKHVHYFVRRDGEADVHDSDVELSPESVYAISKYLPPHPDSKKSNVHERETH